MYFGRTTKLIFAIKSKYFKSYFCVTNIPDLRRPLEATQVIEPYKNEVCVEKYNLNRLLLHNVLFLLKHWHA